MNYGTYVLKDSAPVAPADGMSPGWKSGQLANLGANATQTVVFDLGPNWNEYRQMMLSIVSTQAITNTTFSVSDDGQNAAHPAYAASLNAVLGPNINAAGTWCYCVVIDARYLILTFTNGPSAQGATASVRLAVMPK